MFVSSGPLVIQYNGRGYILLLLGHSLYNLVLQDTLSNSVFINKNIIILIINLIIYTQHTVCFHQHHFYVLFHFRGILMSHWTFQMSLTRQGPLYHHSLYMFVWNMFVWNKHYKRHISQVIQILVTLLIYLFKNIQSKSWGDKILNENYRL
jgi:hypothetical protein